LTVPIQQSKFRMAKEKDFTRSQKLLVQLSKTSITWYEKMHKLICRNLNHSLIIVRIFRQLKLIQQLTFKEICQSTPHLFSAMEWIVAPSWQTTYLLDLTSNLSSRLISLLVIPQLIILQEGNLSPLSIAQDFKSHSKHIVGSDLSQQLWVWDNLNRKRSSSKLGKHQDTVVPPSVQTKPLWYISHKNKSGNSSHLLMALTQMLKILLSMAAEAIL
jgi:hypothetical protein